MSDMKISAPTALVIAAIVGAGAFAAGRSTTTRPDTMPVAESTTTHAAESASPQALPQGHPPTGGAAHGGELPSGHPPLGADTPAAPPAAAAEAASLTWTAPARWQKAPNPSAMRLATYMVPRAAGDMEDAELSVTQVGGSVDANAERWVGQFGEEGKKTAKREKKKVAGLDVTIVEVEGTYTGGMGPGAGPEKGWALLGAIVETPGMPHFFKLTGPSKSVKAARAEMEQLLSSMKTGAPKP